MLVINNYVAHQYHVIWRLLQFNYLKCSSLTSCFFYQRPQKYNEYVVFRVCFEWLYDMQNRLNVLTFGF